jgi:hypothetical protein
MKNTIQNIRLIETISAELHNSDIVLPRYGSETIWQLAEKIAEKIVEKRLA